MKKELFLLLFLVFSPFTNSSERSECKVVFDAGSTGTRLYIFEKTKEDWIIHEGPKSDGGIADPIRNINGKSAADIDSSINRMINLLNLIEELDPKGKWLPFNWRKQCKISYLGVLATGGMRLAEQDFPEESMEFWKKVTGEIKQFFKNESQPTSLFEKLKLLFGAFYLPKLEIRTISGVEEGLFAWYSLLPRRQGDWKFGLIEMGGASAQIVFPCKFCKMGKNVILGEGKQVMLFIHSFLGLGENSVLEKFGVNEFCKHGSGLSSNWDKKQCSDSMKIEKGNVLIDFFNYDDKGNLPSFVSIPKATPLSSWYLTGSFQYNDSIDLCCKTDEKTCFRPETACFKSVYKDKFLNLMGIDSGEKSNVSWTYGAILCQDKNCLSKAGALHCSWMKTGCLKVK